MRLLGVADHREFPADFSGLGRVQFQFLRSGRRTSHAAGGADRSRHGGPPRRQIAATDAGMSGAEGLLSLLQLQAGEFPCLTNHASPLSDRTNLGCARALRIYGMWTQLRAKSGSRAHVSTRPQHNTR